MSTAVVDPPDEDPVCKRRDCGHSFFYDHAAQGFGERTGKPMRCRVMRCACPDALWEPEKSLAPELPDTFTRTELGFSP